MLQLKRGTHSDQGDPVGKSVARRETGHRRRPLSGYSSTCCTIHYYDTERRIAHREETGIHESHHLLPGISLARSY